MMQPQPLYKSRVVGSIISGHNDVGGIALHRHVMRDPMEDYARSHI
jgi:hypothetical protein